MDKILVAIAFIIAFEIIVVGTIISGNIGPVIGGLVLAGMVFFYERM